MGFGLQTHFQSRYPPMDPPLHTLFTHNSSKLFLAESTELFCHAYIFCSFLDHIQTFDNIQHFIIFNISTIHFTGTVHVIPEIKTSVAQVAGIPWRQQASYVTRLSWSGGLYVDVVTYNQRNVDVQFQ